MREPHYIKFAGPAAAPSNILVFDTETWHGSYARVPGGEYQRLRLGVALAYRLDGAKRTRVTTLEFTDPGCFWRLVESMLSNRRPLWIFAHNTAYDIGAINGWLVILGKDFKCKTTIFTQGVFLIKGWYHGKPVIIADLANYFHCSLEQVGSAVGLPKLEMPSQSDPDSAWFRYCKNDVLVTAAGVDSLIAFVRTNELGPWAPSIAGLAYNAFRSRFMRHKILVHTEWDDLRTERGAYYGGIVDTPYIGRVPFSSVHELDVCSMYAAMCLKPLPYRRITSSVRVGPKRLLDCPPDQMIIADVEIDHDTLQFPIRTKNGTVYPTGKYRTSLAHPELMLALHAGAVKWVYRAIWYKSGNILADYMEYFGDKKIQYDREGNMAFRTLAKYYLTNLYGKFGQQSPQWQEWGPESLSGREMSLGLPSGALEFYYDKPPSLMCKCPAGPVGTGISCERCHQYTAPGWVESYTNIYGHHYDIRNWFGYVEIKGDRHESRDSCPAIAATVTSYARCFLRECIATAGDKQCVYSDTDSIWVSDIGLARLQERGLVEDGVLGKLAYKKAHKYLEVFGPKDYRVPDSIKLKGIKPLTADYIQSTDCAVPVHDGSRVRYFIRTPDGEFRQTQFASALTQIRTRQWGGVMVKHLLKKLYRQQTKCVVGPDGWTRPLRFPEETP